MDLKTKFLLSLIMLLAFLFRFYELDTIPPGLHPDVAIDGLDALQSLQTGDFKVFYSDNQGREGLIMWLDAASMAIFGVNALALRVPAAIFGTLTILGIYLFSRQLFAREGIALLAAFFCSVSFWHVNFSRIGFRSILMPVFLVFFLLFLWKALEEKSLWSGIISGVFFGLGFYTYTPFRFAVLLLLAILFLWFIQEGRETIKISFAMLLTTFLISLPIGIYFLFHPVELLSRAGQVGVWATPNPLFTFIKSLTLNLLMFNIRGDANWYHNFSGDPELFWLIGILFLLGLAISFKNAHKANKSYLILLLWFLILLLPGAFTFEGIPSSQRVVGVIPPVMIFSAIGGIAIYDQLKPRIPKTAFTALILLFIISIIFQGYHQYFITWADNPNVETFTADFDNAGKLTYQLHQQGINTIIIDDIGGLTVPYPNGIQTPMSSMSTLFNETCAHYYKNEPYSTYLEPNQLNQIVIKNKTAIIPLKYNQDIFDSLRELFPQGQIKELNGMKYMEIQ